LNEDLLFPKLKTVQGLDNKVQQAATS